MPEIQRQSVEATKVPGRVRRSQSPNSWLFYDARISAGFPTLDSLAQKIGAPKVSVYEWQRGSSRPRAKYMLRLEEVLFVPLPDLVKALWREEIGDLCLCGCGGKKAFPEGSPNARALVIELPCVQCQSIRTYYGRTRHSKLCGKCARSKDRVKHPKFNCIGTSGNCLGERRMAPWEQRRRQKKAQSNPNSYFDRAARKYRCANCTRSEHVTASTAKRLRNFLAQKYPRQNPPKIRSRKLRLTLQSANVREMYPNLIEAGRKALKSRARNSGYVAPGVTRAHLIRWWSRPPKDLPKYVRFGLCIGPRDHHAGEVCGKVVIHLNKSPKFHKRCYNEWMRTSEGKHAKSLWRRGLQASTPEPKSGLRVRLSAGDMSGTEDSLKISFSWAVQHYLGTFHIEERSSGRKLTVIKRKSFWAIAKENGVDSKAVKYRIASLIDKLPEPDSLQPRWQRAVRFLLDASKQAPPYSAAALHG